MPTSRPLSTMWRRISGSSGWSVTAAPTRPTRRASGGISDATRAGATRRMPPLVDRRITQ